MRKKFTLLAFCIASLLLVVQGLFNSARSYQEGAPAGYTGSPADGKACTACHTPPGTNFSSGAGLITSNIPSSGYVASETYTFTASVKRPGHVKFGFEVSPQDTTTAGKKEGSILITDSARTQLASATADYITHTAAGNVATGDSDVWSFKWTAPVTGHGPVVFYGAFNVTNDNGAPTGDSIFLTSLKVYECAAPVAPASITGAASVCPGVSTVYSVAAGAAGTTFTWTLPSGWTGSSTSNSITVTPGSASGSISVKATNSCGSSNSVSKAVTVNPATATVTAGGATTFCEGDSVVLTAAANSLYKWSSGQITQAIIAKVTGSYVVTVTNANGCTAASTAKAVTVNTLPSATVTASGPTKFCKGGSVTLTASVNSSYKWSDNKTTRAIKVTATGSYVVTVTGTNGCTAASAATAVTVTALPKATIDSAGSLCNKDSVQLTATKISKDTYLWSTGATTNVIEVKAAGTYKVTVTNTAKCSTIDSSVIRSCANAPMDEADKTDGTSDNENAQSPLTDNSDLQVSVYPNPYSGEFHLKLQSSNTTDNINIRIFDISGRLTEEKINVAAGSDIILGYNYASGFYSIQVQQGQLNRQVRVIKM
jgi:hypothetical protein